MDADNKMHKIDAALKGVLNSAPLVMSSKLSAHSEASHFEILKSGHILARMLIDDVAEPDRLALARTFGSRLISEWWHSLKSIEGTRQALRIPSQSFDLVRLSSSSEVLAAGLGQAAARLKPETAAYHIGLAYTCMLPRSHRATLGIYYTPPCLAVRLIEQATFAGVDWTACRVLDPACGGGAFLAPVARRILDELPDCSPSILIKNITNRLRGFEIDPFGAWLSQVALDAVLLPITRSMRGQLPAVVTVCDSLRESSVDDRFDLVIGNPPYGRVRLAPRDRARFKRSLFGHANLYGLFTDIALHHTRSGGVIAYVTPTSFLAGEYFKNLRSLLCEDAPPVTFDFVSSRKGVFDEVLQETLLTTYKRGSKPAPVTVHEITPVSDATLSVSRAGSFAPPADRSDPWILPRSAWQARQAKSLARMEYRLADWGYAVSTGPLVWNRHKDQLATEPGCNRHPLIWAEAITPDGEFIWRAAKRNHTPWFEIRDGDNWLLTNRQCVLLQRTTAKEQCRRLIAAVLPKRFLETHSAIVVENHLNMLRPLTERPPVPVEVLAAFLNSSAADRAFRCVSGSVAVSAYELEALPLPNPSDMGELSQLVRHRVDREQIDVACAQLYEDAT